MSRTLSPVWPRRSELHSGSPCKAPSCEQLISATTAAALRQGSTLDQSTRPGAAHLLHPFGVCQLSYNTGPSVLRTSSQRLVVSSDLGFRAVAPQSQSRLLHKLWADVPRKRNVRGLHHDAMVSSGPPKSLLPKVLRAGDKTSAKDAKEGPSGFRRSREAFVCQRHLPLSGHVQSFGNNTACPVRAA